MNSIPLLVIEADKGEWKGWGTRNFAVAPRVGEYITANDEAGIGQAYEVVAVLHTDEPANAAGDLIIKHVGTDVDLRRRLNPGPARVISGMTVSGGDRD